jgi:hypothetical protein
MRREFFENGVGKRIARVGNGARRRRSACRRHRRLVRSIPCANIRASVDYDGLGPSEHERFNLVVQRVRSAGSELVEDQEIYRRVSIAPGASRYINDVLLESRLVRVTGSLPAQRPDRSAGGPGGVAVGYTLSNPDGDDGAPLSDYDIIGAAPARTGLFAPRSTLQPAVHPPLTRGAMGLPPAAARASP